MLEKNKDYLEMRVSSTDCAFAQNEWAQVCVDEYVYTTYMNIPDPGELYVFISKEKFDQLQTENEELKKKSHEFDIMPDYKELLKELYSIEDTEMLEWALNHTCGGRGSVNGWRAVSSFWSEKYKKLSKLVGFSSVKEIEDYLTNEAECDTLHEAISKLKDQVKHTCDEWYSANSSNNSWKAAAECNSPKELIEKLNLLRDDISGRSMVIEHYKRDIEKWQTMTKCETPEAAATWITSYELACERGNRLAEMVEKLKEFDYTAAWQKATGCSTPEEIKSRIEGLENAVRLTNKNMLREIESTIDEWQKATGCNIPDDVEIRIKALNERIDESEACYNHLRKALVDYEFDYEELLKLTGYKSNQDIRVALNYSEQFVYKDMRELINSLKRKAKFTESNWQKVTGFSTPEKCSSYIDRLEKKLEDIKNLTEED